MQTQLPTLVSEYNSDDTVTPDVPMQIKQSSLDSLPSSSDLEDTASIATTQHRLSNITASIKITADIMEFSYEQSDSDYSDLSESHSENIRTPPDRTNKYLTSYNK